jgi:hypothetical protein
VADEAVGTAADVAAMVVVAVGVAAAVADEAVAEIAVTAVTAGNQAFRN